jgi:hypothetical protein
MPTEMVAWQADFGTRPTEQPTHRCSNVQLQRIKATDFSGRARALFIVCIHQRCRILPSTRSSAARERGLQRRRRVVRRRRGLAHLTKRARRLRDPRLHVLCEPWLADQQNAGPRALRIPAFEPDRADAGFVRFDGGKPH